MRTCKQIIELSSRQLDEKLPLRTQLEMGVHFLMCRFCRRYSKQLSTMQQALVAMDTPIENKKLSTQAKQRIAKKLYSNKSTTDINH